MPVMLFPLLEAVAVAVALRIADRVLDDLFD